MNAIAQTPDGYLWLGTFGGLVRFDGSRFTAVERTDAAGAHTDRVLALAVTADSALWIGTETAGLLRWKDGAYEARVLPDELPDNAVTTLHAAADGTLWIGTAHGGVARLEDGRLRTVREANGVSVGRVVSFVEGASDTMWINAGDRHFTMARGTLSLRDPAVNPVPEARYMPLEETAGARWFTLEDGMARVRADAVRIFDLPDGALMVEDPEEGVWIGTGNDGLFFLRPDRSGAGALHRYSLPDGRAAFRVRSMHVDRSGNVWVGTDANGLLRARRNLFTTYTAEHGLSHDVATAVLQATDGTLWAATNCGGVNAIDLRDRTVRVHNPRSPGDPEGDPCVFALSESAGGVVWQGSYGGGVTPLVGQAPARVPALPDTIIRALYTDPGGILWVGTGSNGLVAVVDGQVRDVYTADDGLADNRVRTIYRARNGDLWVGTLGGLSRLRDGRFTTFTAADGLSSGH
ncbi:MAG: ligand-binding sensor domain-containing protein, partial [Gemmatimonadota bacterium]